MSLFLPILLLGFAQIAEQSVPSAPVDQSTGNTAAAVLNSPKFKSLGLPRQIFIHPDTPFEDENLCFTMRTYLFERRNGFAPEPVGVTSCQPASARKQKQVMSRPRLVPAN